VLVLQVSDGAFVREARTRVHASADVLSPDAEPRAFVDGDDVLLDATLSVDTNAVPRPLRYGWSLVARPSDSLVTRDSVRAVGAAQARFTPDVDGIYVFRLRVDNGAHYDARNVLVRYARVPTADATRAAAATPTAPITARSPEPKNADVAFGPGVLRLALNLHPRALDVTAGGRGTIDVKLVASGQPPSDDDELHGLERNNKSARGGSVHAALVASGVPPGVTVQFGDADLAPGETTTMTVTAAATDAPGVYRLQLTASPLGADVAIVPTSSVTLRIRAPLRATPVACGGVDVSKLANKVYVSPTGSNTTGCGGSTATACATIQQGIDKLRRNRVLRARSLWKIFHDDEHQPEGRRQRLRELHLRYRRESRLPHGHRCSSRAGGNARADGARHQQPNPRERLVVVTNDATARSVREHRDGRRSEQRHYLGEHALVERGRRTGRVGNPPARHKPVREVQDFRAPWAAPAGQAVSQITPHPPETAAMAASSPPTARTSAADASSTVPAPPRASRAASHRAAARGPTGTVGIWCTNRPHDQPATVCPA
jgi:hypothetical protein